MFRWSRCIKCRVRHIARRRCGVFICRFFALPNILCGRFVAPEMLQRDANPPALARQLRRILTDDAVRAAQIAAWSALRLRLSAGGGAAAAAREALALVCEAN